MPAVQCSEEGRRAAHWLKATGGLGNRHELDSAIDTDALIQTWREDMAPAEREEVARLRSGLRREKVMLEQALEEEMAALMEKGKYTAVVKRQFVIQVEGRG